MNCTAASTTLHSVQTRERQSQPQVHRGGVAVSCRRRAHREAAYGCSVQRRSAEPELHNKRALLPYSSACCRLTEERTHTQAHVRCGNLGHVVLGGKEAPPAPRVPRLRLQLTPQQHAQHPHVRLRREHIVQNALRTHPPAHTQSAKTHLLTDTHATVAHRMGMAARCDCR